jgi:alpha-beta hydrolase superfamily lysophospholipase
MTLDRRCLLLAAAALAGCVGRLQPMGPVIGPPAMTPPGTEEAIVAADGYRLPLRRWLPAAPPRAVILALHGANDHAGGFADAAAFWAQLGLATYAYDQRGFGGSSGRGIWPGTATLAADATAAMTVVRAHHPDLPLILLGESMGGAVAIVAATEPGAPRPDGLVLAAPAAWGLQAMGTVEKAALWLVSTFMPAMTFTGEGLDLQASDNIPMLVALGRDPLYIGETRADTIAGLVDLMTVAYDRIPSIGERTLVLYGENEEVLSPASVDAVLSHLPDRPADAPDGIVAASYKNGWHLLLRDLGRRTPQRDIAAWILAPGAPLPSGADVRGAAWQREARAE